MKNDDKKCGVIHINMRGFIFCIMPLGSNCCSAVEKR